MDDTKRARVFLSCGQRGDTERETARRVSRLLGERGYDVYVAVYEQDIGSIVQNVFDWLGKSEYFLFVDFDRQSDEYLPFSLYSHQELAIAGYLHLPAMIFCQKGRKRIGMADHLQINPIEFDTPNDLLERVEAQLNDFEVEGHWNPTHRNELELRVYEDVAQEMIVTDYDPFLWFHLEVQNKNKFRHAQNCTAFLSSMRWENDQQSMLGEPIPDLKWAGLLDPLSMINKGHSRRVAAICRNKVTGRVHVAISVDGRGIVREMADYLSGKILDYGNYILEYTVVSENFSDAQIRTRLTIGEAVDDFRLEEIPDSKD